MTASDTTNYDHTFLRIESQYLPCLEYFTCILNHEEIWIDTEERYQKQTYRNRCKVLTANGTDILTVPVRSYPLHRTTKEICIDYSQDWIRRHLGCLRAAYGKSPYFEYYFHEFESVYQKKPELLVDLNSYLLTICLRLVGIRSRITYNLSVPAEVEIDIENAISLINNKKAPDFQKFYSPAAYYQTFGNDFVSNLSIVDLIFNMGPEARGVLNKSMNKIEAI